MVRVGSWKPELTPDNLLLLRRIVSVIIPNKILHRGDREGCVFSVSCQKLKDVESIVKIVELNGEDLVKDYSDEIERMLGSKMKSVKVRRRKGPLPSRGARREESC